MFCDREEQWTAKLWKVFEVECACCAFYRGVIAGGIVSFVLTLALCAVF